MTSQGKVAVTDIANGTDGELITWNASGAPATVAVGTSTHVLTSNGTGVAPTFQAAYQPGGTDVAVADGGTNLSVYAVGDVVYASGTTVLAKLAKPGTPAGEVLTFAACATAPSWVAAAAGGVDTTGSPANNQIATFTDADTLQGEAELTYVSGQLTMNHDSGAAIINLDGSTGQSQVKLRNAGTTKWEVGMDADGASNQKSHVDDFSFYSSGGYGVVISGEGTNKFGIGTQAGIALSSAEIPDDGIQFPTTQVANASPKNLDDYEEGTWTPSVTFGGASSGITYAATRYGRYTKIGDLVTVWGRIELTSNGSSGGHLMIAGLPFDPVATAPISAGGYLSQLTFTGPICMVVDQGTTIMDFYETVSGGGATTMTHADVADSAVFGWTGSYSI
jgi:hypothetical protein